jgi:hypothetical protein
MIRFISAYEIIPHIIAVRIGAAMRILMRLLLFLVDTVMSDFIGIFKKLKIAGPKMFRITMVMYEPKNGMMDSSAVSFTSWGPSIAETSPAAMT